MTQIWTQTTISDITPVEPKIDMGMKELPELAGHSRKVYALGWNACGTRLASGSTDKSIRLWDIDTSTKNIAEMRGHTEGIHQLSWNPTCSTGLATTAADKTVRIWDTKSGRASHSISMSAENYNISYSHDGNYIAASNQECISLVDTRKCRVIHKVVNPYEVNEVKFSQSGHMFVAAGHHPAGYGAFEIMKIAHGGESTTLENVQHVAAHSGNCFCLDLDPQNKYLAVGSVDSLVSLWDLQELYCVRTLVRCSSTIRCLSFSCDGQYLASGSEEKQIDISDVNTGERAHTIELQATMQYLSWHPKKLILAYVGDRSSKNERDRNRDGVIKLVQITNEP